MREIVLDTETTGINPNEGHRIIEIGALELMHHLPTGKQLHLYINPERDIDAGAAAIHGLTSSFLADKPIFSSIADEFLEFIGESKLIIHNASFDMSFINSELNKIQREILPMSRTVDTLAMARLKFPGAQASLDALCRRFEIDNTHRNLHGALIDADLLASVYIELLGGRQPGLSLSVDYDDKNQTARKSIAVSAESFKIDENLRHIRPIRAHTTTNEEQVAHEEFLKKINNPIWCKS